MCFISFQTEPRGCIAKCNDLTPTLSFFCFCPPTLSLIFLTCNSIFAFSCNEVEHRNLMVPANKQAFTICNFLVLSQVELYRNTISSGFTWPVGTSDGCVVHPIASQ